VQTSSGSFALAGKMKARHSQIACQTKVLSNYHSEELPYTNKQWQKDESLIHHPIPNYV
jgi:hypothetical protein